MAVEAVQAVVLVAVALLLGWRPSGGAGAVVQAALAGALATLAFAGVGLAMAGRLRAEMVLAAANGLYLLLLLLGGMVVRVDRLPGALAVVARLLPAAALSDVLRAAFLAGSAPSEAWVVLAAWALMAPLVASLTFRWD
jgi:ABC-2 type transport system permease protein